jgi:hypothetical protein
MTTSMHAEAKMNRKLVLFAHLLVSPADGAAAGGPP